MNLGWNVMCWREYCCSILEVEMFELDKMVIDGFM